MDFQAFVAIIFTGLAFLGPLGAWAAFKLPSEKASSYDFGSPREKAFFLLVILSAVLMIAAISVSVTIA